MCGVGAGLEGVGTSSVDGAWAQEVESASTDAGADCVHVRRREGADGEARRGGVTALLEACGYQHELVVCNGHPMGLRKYAGVDRVRQAGGNGVRAHGGESVVAGPSGAGRTEGGGAGAGAGGVTMIAGRRRCADAAWSLRGATVWCVRARRGEECVVCCTWSSPLTVLDSPLAVMVPPEPGRKVKKKTGEVQDASKWRVFFPLRVSYSSN